VFSIIEFTSLPAVTCANDIRSTRTLILPVRDYDLEATLTSGQAFRWDSCPSGWETVLGTRWVRVSLAGGCLRAETAEAVESWDWLTRYLQLETDLANVLAEFPADEPMRLAVDACRGLRLLRQEPWECLASFILSSTKQIVQIRQIVRLLCERFGDRVVAPADHAPAYAFPSAARLAQVSETELRACKMGFRAPYLQATALALASGDLELRMLEALGVEEARSRLMALPGVGRKIADCVLLFAFGFQNAFPVDVWVAKGLRELYFPGRRANRKRLERFSQTHFGRYAGYAQQYLFHYMRTRPKVLKQ
jgi:N-glycosylase/DNA lyase